MSPPVPPAVLTHARAQYGLVTLAQLNKARVSRRRRTELLESRFLEPVHRGVYRLGSHDVGFEQSCLAACLALSDAVISGPSAGRLLGLRRMPTGLVHVLVKTRNTELDNVVIHRTTALSRADWTTRKEDGIRVLRPVRLAVDLARHLDDHDLESVIEQLIDRRTRVDPALHGCGSRLAGSGP